ncbi:uncharacterized protein SCHCODRAFT_02726786 [Schizophyllum commune H4-8]|uniref:uncharacterized protein n=1 Tax=Schizophyllum commune (strain H4-8 / FGSC 9210) TaxID=578458 RepID=UPI00215EDA1A|nr:uncharacterized protein SCHCODRAFT_02726786 [Schizophyllum commune H4-8]KAI5894809.1 hypothetical protein SCHCODRAFT_02726786 [Schizophyllum commune H4-8]
MPYAGGSARSSAETRRTTASMSSKPVGEGTTRWMTASVREGGCDQDEWPARRGEVSPQRTDGSGRPDEGWYSRRYTSHCCQGGRPTRPHRGTKGKHTRAGGEGCHGVQGGPFPGVLAPQPLQRRGRRPSLRMQPKPREAGPLGGGGGSRGCGRPKAARRGWGDHRWATPTVANDERFWIRELPEVN